MTMTLGSASNRYEPSRAEPSRAEPSRAEPSRAESSRVDAGATGVLNVPPMPSAYVDGYPRARALDRETADNYIAHTHIGDPVMDAIVEDLASLPQRRVHEFIHAGMEEDRGGLRNAPQSLRDFFFDAPPPDPDWLDHDAFQPGVRSFQRNSVLVLSAFVAGVLIDGFSTLISKSFVQTGRIFDNGVWRLKQNNRHQVEIFLPGGLERFGEGWKLSVRIRFVHAQIRRLLGQTEEWEHDACGVTPATSWASRIPSSSPTSSTRCTCTGSAPFASLLRPQTRSS